MLLILRYWIFIIIAIIILIIIILFALYKRRRDEETRKMRLRRKLSEVVEFVSFALRKGYKPREIKSMLLLKGWKEDTVDMAINEVVSGRLKKR